MDRGGVVDERGREDDIIPLSTVPSGGRLSVVHGVDGDETVFLLGG